MSFLLNRQHTDQKHRLVLQRNPINSQLLVLSCSSLAGSNTYKLIQCRLQFAWIFQCLGMVPLDAGRNLRSLPIQLTPELLYGFEYVLQLLLKDI